MTYPGNIESLIKNLYPNGKFAYIVFWTQKLLTDNSKGILLHVIKSFQPDQNRQYDLKKQASNVCHEYKFWRG